MKVLLHSGRYFDDVQRVKESNGDVYITRYNVTLKLKNQRIFETMEDD